MAAAEHAYVMDALHHAKVETVVRVMEWQARRRSADFGDDNRRLVRWAASLALTVDPEHDRERIAETAAHAAPADAAPVGPTFKVRIDGREPGLWWLVDCTCGQGPLSFPADCLEAALRVHLGAVHGIIT